MRVQCRKCSDAVTIRESSFSTGKRDRARLRKSGWLIGRNGSGFCPEHKPKKRRNRYLEAPIGQGVVYEIVPGVGAFGLEPEKG